jgi:histone-lysine N-methyltransferase SETMAR
MVTVFWDSEGVMQRGTKINSDSYISTLKKMRMHLQCVQPDKTLCSMLLKCDNKGPHTSIKTGEAITQFGWMVLLHPPYRPSLAPTDFHLFRSLKDAFCRRKFESNDDVLSAVRTCCVNETRNGTCQAYTSFHADTKP